MYLISMIAVMSYAAVPFAFQIQKTVFVQKNAERVKFGQMIQDWQTRENNNPFNTSQLENNSLFYKEYIRVKTAVDRLEENIEGKAQRLNFFMQGIEKQYYKPDSNNNDHWPTTTELMSAKHKGDDCDGLELIPRLYFKEAGYLYVYRGIFSFGGNSKYKNHMATVVFRNKNDTDPLIVDPTSILEASRISELNGKWSLAVLFNEHSILVPSTKQPTASHKVSAD
ncbi:MAG: hypothetical protein A3H62_02490 [Candidatus Ryanbacteria bacterium RIFCSPLOWO2_02_FULL_44_40]|nr:MAG: hypothetical protein A2718_02820 [Candidatus Ryanbacteria bacterium RIFCSPHIGHO2_01_FULL_44_130]OGZ51962.1 MAG: hypothetical protein A3A17_00845 [Candidatus Ryanbacteria bacterium RIFCSPLOWO2_01_FULL_44_230]OGZ53941.1 MAG: hypothetical protein A3H62_02490 [Candidatus Ryanbacteria bacterium RIFCSPLOWO2_02_FULL_44_40]